MAKKTYKEKLAEAKAAAKRGYARAREAGGKAKPFVVAGAAGAATHYGLRLLDANVPSVLRSSKYAPGGVTLVAAMLVNKKSHTAALGMAGAAGLLLAQAFDGPTSQPQPSAPAPTTKGYEPDTSAMQGPDVSALELPDSMGLDDTGAFQDAGDPAEYN